jgi:hypothetical protein
MLVGLFKVLLFYFAFVFIKNVVKGYLSYQGIKGRMNQGSDQKGEQAKKKSSQGEVFEAEYRVLKDE